VEVHHLATACADSAVSPLCLEYNKLRRIRLLRTFSAVKEALMREEPFKADESA
jgi:hypothetical protein